MRLPAITAHSCTVQLQCAVLHKARTVSLPAHYLPTQLTRACTVLAAVVIILRWDVLVDGQRGISSWLLLLPFMALLGLIIPPWLVEEVVMLCIVTICGIVLVCFLGLLVGFLWLSIAVLCTTLAG